MRTDLQVQMWNIHRLVAYEKNARLHTDQQIAQIVNSIKQVLSPCGTIVPIDIGAV